ncbi:type I restriction enzyme S subunit [Cellulosimicrobium cellulans]|uniref:restriction endonuclease subunit S n=1 Tax=Cellulosimicrobium cellulans TaxID=1710 RepID=UPI00195AD2D0|nr:restriction endonuclease subunit S [Cellulosimicrobium cellulans]MBM7819178.1 type I restriction enzyme S subunit [Cellulosimicrobium cellulans]
MSIRLEEALEVLIDHRGKTPRKLGSDFVSEGVPVASAILVRDGVLDLSEARFVDEETYSRWMPVPVKRGDVLLTSEAPLGRVARVRDDAPLVLGQRLFGLRGKNGVLDDGFLYYALQTDRLQSELSGRATGTTVVGIRQSALRDVRISLPEFSTQRAIGDVLGALDDKIAANTRLVTTAGHLAAATVRRALDTSASSRLDELAVIKMGSSPTGETLNESGDGLVFYQGVRDFGTRFPSRRVWTTAPTRTADEGDVLVSVRAPVGEVNLANEHLCIGRGLAAVRSRSAHQSTLFHLLKHVPEAWAPYEAEGTVFGSINRAQLHSLELPRLADGIDPEALESEVRALESRIASALRESSTLTALRDTLLPQLMSGKLRVREAAEMAGL